MQQAPDGTLFYHGHSMRGTFRPGDRLVIEPVALDVLRPGDVVVYRKEDGNPGDAERDKVVHRVMRVVPGGLVLRGDNNPARAVEVVLAEDIVGRVTHVRRGARTRPVRGGRGGMRRARGLHGWHSARRGLGWLGWQTLRLVARRPYRWLRASGLVARVWHPTLTRVHLATEDGPLIKFVHGRRTIAECWPQRRTYRCRKPYDLVLRPEDVRRAVQQWLPPAPVTEPAEPEPTVPPGN